LRESVLAGTAVLIVLCRMMSGQTAQPAVPVVAPAAAVKFEIADIHSSWRRYNPYLTGGSLVGDRYVIHQATMLDLIKAAYGIEEPHILGGPMWLESTRYEVLAKAPNGATNADLQPMLRALLADRFKLVVRADTKPMPAYLLSVGKGEPKLKKADPAEQSGCGLKRESSQQTPAVAGSTPLDVTVFCKNATMDQFAQMVGYNLPYPVVDKTGLAGNWDVEFHLAMPPRPDGLTAADALKGQLGLKLELGTAPLPVEVVESVSEPSPNSPDLVKLMPPPARQEFEVAVIKPVPPHTRTNVQVNGHEFTIGGGTMQFLIMYSYDVSEAALVDIPPWFLTTRFAITAKIPVDPAAKNNRVDMEDVKAMLRSLLADRFRLKVHEDVRPQDGPMLVAAGPKLKKAVDTEIRPTCFDGPGPDGKDPRIANPALKRLITCQNVSMADFAEGLSSIFNYRIPVVDGTGLSGRYDLQLVFTGNREIAAATSASVAASADTASAASDPSGAITLVDALPTELGLKLVQKKEPVPVLVVDHIDETPTEN
jgi:uncharacterized protein (TIGR03435 family)